MDTPAVVPKNYGPLGHLETKLGGEQRLAKKLVTINYSV